MIFFLLLFGNSILLYLYNINFANAGNPDDIRTSNRYTEYFGGYVQPSSVKSQNFDQKEDKVVPSILENHPLDIDGGKEGNTLTLLSIVVDPEVFDTKWYIPSYHERYSAGWNRTTNLPFLNRPGGCHIRMYGIAVESKFQAFAQGGTGKLQFNYRTNRGKKGYRDVYVGYDHDPIPRKHIWCYYSTNQRTGSDFIDDPKTLGVAIYCPITLDQESGIYHFKAAMHAGHICRPMMDHPTNIQLTLVESDVKVKEPFDDHFMKDKKIINVAARSTPAALRTKQFTADSYSTDIKVEAESLMSSWRDDTIGLRPGNNDAVKDISKPSDATVASTWKGRKMYRPHAVCAVLTFINPGTGPLLYLFVQHWYRLGWTVIIYDRFGMHREFIRELLHWPGFYYHPYTVYQLSNPKKYNSEYQRKQGSDNKIYYKIEQNWGYSGARVNDLPDQDGDKTKTYDMARLEYPLHDSILYVDIDELIICPQRNVSVNNQRSFIRTIMDSFVFQGIQEMRFVRLPYGAFVPKGEEAYASIKDVNDTVKDFTIQVQNCMRLAFDKRDPIALASCWSSATAYDNFYKSGDLAGVCPFHYNHWSCDGMKGGGRDWGSNIPRCRCKVGFDMMNGHSYMPHLNKCHLVHLHHNKYRFQSGRMKHKWDRGSVHELNPIARFWQNSYDNAMKKDTLTLDKATQ